VSVGILLLRVVLGLLFVGHGTQKLFGWFGGGGPPGATGYFHSLGYPAWTILALAAGATEAGSGTLMALGLLTPLAAAGIIGMMTNVLFVKWAHGLWEVHDGYEYPLLIIASAASLAFIGAGRYSLDHAIGWGIHGVAWGVAGLALGGVTGILVRSSRRFA
jgi:putative oxidoreductase